MFQRRHYDFLADVLNRSVAKRSAAWDQIVNELTTALTRENINFQPRRFREAAGKDNVVNLRPVSRIGNYGG